MVEKNAAGDKMTLALAPATPTKWSERRGKQCKHAG
jgi:hypothetical protein